MGIVLASIADGATKSPRFVPNLPFSEFTYTHVLGQPNTSSISVLSSTNFNVDIQEYNDDLTLVLRVPTDKSTDYPWLPSTGTGGQHPYMH